MNVNTDSTTTNTGANTTNTINRVDECCRPFPLGNITNGDRYEKKLTKNLFFIVGRIKANL